MCQREGEKGIIVMGAYKLELRIWLESKTSFVVVIHSLCQNEQNPRFQRDQKSSRSNWKNAERYKMAVKNESPYEVWKFKKTEKERS